MQPVLPLLMHSRNVLKVFPNRIITKKIYVIQHGIYGSRLNNKKSMASFSSATDNKSIKEINETLKDLHQEIKTSNVKSSRLNLSMVRLTWVIAALTVIIVVTGILEYCSSKL